MSARDASSSLRGALHLLWRPARSSLRAPPSSMAKTPRIRKPAPTDPPPPTPQTEPVMGVPEQTASDPADAPVYTDIPEAPRVTRRRPRDDRRRGNACGTGRQGRREEDADRQARGATCVWPRRSPRPRPLRLPARPRQPRPACARRGRSPKRLSACRPRRRCPTRSSRQESQSQPSRCGSPRLLRLSRLHLRRSPRTRRRTSRCQPRRRHS